MVVVVVVCARSPLNRGAGGSFTSQFSARIRGTGLREAKFIHHHVTYCCMDQCDLFDRDDSFDERSYALPNSTGWTSNVERLSICSNDVRSRAEKYRLGEVGLKSSASFPWYA
jgi:hypothetical protein